MSLPFTSRANKSKDLTRVFLTAEFSDASARFYCRVYHAQDFQRMRDEVMESSQDDFVRSLSHCVNWQARGGKSGAVFYATEGWCPPAIFLLSLYKLNVSV